jgi:hypothetical protein
MIHFQKRVLGLIENVSFRHLSSVDGSKGFVPLHGPASVQLSFSVLLQNKSQLPESWDETCHIEIGVEIAGIAPVTWMMKTAACLYKEVCATVAGGSLRCSKFFAAVLSLVHRSIQQLVHWIDRVSPSLGDQISVAMLTWYRMIFDLQLPRTRLYASSRVLACAVKSMRGGSKLFGPHTIVTCGVRVAILRRSSFTAFRGHSHNSLCCSKNQVIGFYSGTPVQNVHDLSAGKHRKFP